MNQQQFPSFKPVTKNGYKLDEVASSLQKDIRRGNEEDALFWALELFPRYAAYAWRRISVVAVEDIEDPMAITMVHAASEAFFRNNDKKKAEDFVNRIFITKTILYLCRAKKSREADHAQFHIDNLVKAKKMKQIPEYAFDCHTQAGRYNGKTKEMFVIEEQEGLDDYGRDDYYLKVVVKPKK